MNNTNYLYGGRKIVNLKSNENEINFVAIGLKNSYKEQIVIEPDIKTDFLSFETQSRNLKLQYKKAQNFELKILKKSLGFKNPTLLLHRQDFKKHNISLKVNNFNQQDYL
ncbi:hypothetical protein ACFS5J_02520 [Flavobacterium chuncheonense]|uniref:Uncharacterized protein n=1 Tax=Flavobacterium chuncheonense TaxID=2026653 RepID=A0ABW5YJ17_9FLAO